MPSIFRQHRRWGLLGLLMAFVLGIVFWGGFNTALEATNTETFCISCHEMKDNVYQEYKTSVHYSNRTGVRATCPDCHVPRDWTHKVVRKIQATNELWHFLRGSIDTREKFLAKRQTLAQHVWRSMRETDSRECRNCHDFKSMDFNAQPSAVSERHRLAEQAGKTCITCHIGIAHELPAEFVKTEHQRFAQQQVACADCHVGMPEPISDKDWGW